MDDYLPIADHGIIGDLHTVALVGANGTIDWYCCPAFDSPSVFAAILDKEKGGFYRIAPVDEDWTSRQLYFPDTNVLITRFFTASGVGEQQAFMPIARSGAHVAQTRRDVAATKPFVATTRASADSACRLPIRSWRSSLSCPPRVVFGPVVLKRRASSSSVMSLILFSVMRPPFAVTTLRPSM